MPQAALLLLACGLCRHMWSINASFAYTLICLTGLGVAFFVTIVIAGASSYACPFQTPASTALRGQWKRIRRGVKRVFSRIRQSWNRRIRCGVKRALLRIRQSWNQRRVRRFFRRPSLSTTTSLGDVQIQELEPEPELEPKSKPEPWLKPKDLAIIRRTNASDAGCVSWIIRNITDPEALDAAVLLAGTIRWFEDGTNAYPPYDLIASTLDACFDPPRKLYPGSRDRAYYSGRAVMWINSLAMCKSWELTNRFPLSSPGRGGQSLDPDLRHLLDVNQDNWIEGWIIGRLLATDPEHTPSHMQWTSDVRLSRAWAMRSLLSYEGLLDWSPDAHGTKIVTPLNATLNHLLSWCILLGSPPAEEVLKVQNKSYDDSYFALLITHSHLR